MGGGRVSLLFLFSFDDLLVGAPFHYVEDDEGAWGGAVFVYFSRGVRQTRDKNANVFYEPVQLRAKGAHSQFGLSIAKLGDIDKDEFHLNGSQFVMALLAKCLPQISRLALPLRTTVAGRCSSSMEPVDSRNSVRNRLRLVNVHYIPYTFK
jgi:hypothetical protein